MIWVESWPEWAQALWFVYVTFHDLIQWALMLIIGYTAWGQRQHKKELQHLVDELREELEHVHEEVHAHMDEDASLHESLGQSGITRGEPRGKDQS